MNQGEAGRATPTGTHGLDDERLFEAATRSGLVSHRRPTTNSKSRIDLETAISLIV